MENQERDGSIQENPTQKKAETNPIRIALQEDPEGTGAFSETIKEATQINHSPIQTKQKNTKKSFQEVLEEVQASHPHGGHIVNSEEE